MDRWILWVAGFPDIFRQWGPFPVVDLVMIGQRVDDELGSESHEPVRVKSLLALVSWLLNWVVEYLELRLVVCPMC